MMKTTELKRDRTKLAELNNEDESLEALVKFAKQLEEDKVKGIKQLDFLDELGYPKQGD